MAFNFKSWLRNELRLSPREASNFARVSRDERRRGLTLVSIRCPLFPFYLPPPLFLRRAKAVTARDTFPTPVYETSPEALNLFLRSPAHFWVQLDANRAARTA